MYIYKAFLESFEYLPFCGFAHDFFCNNGWGGVFARFWHQCGMLGWVPWCQRTVEKTAAFG